MRRTAARSKPCWPTTGLFHLEADLRWIDLTEARLAPVAKAIEKSWEGAAVSSSALGRITRPENARFE